MIDKGLIQMMVTILHTCVYVLKWDAQERLLIKPIWLQESPKDLRTRYAKKIFCSKTSTQAFCGQSRHTDTKGTGFLLWGARTGYYNEERIEEKWKKKKTNQRLKSTQLTILLPRCVDDGRHNKTLSNYHIKKTNKTQKTDPFQQVWDRPADKNVYRYLAC